MDEVLHFINIKSKIHPAKIHPVHGGKT